MKATRTLARRILRQTYPDMARIVITRKDRVANIPTRDIERGTPVLIWRALDGSVIASHSDTVEIGRVRNMLSLGASGGQMDIDWSWEPTPVRAPAERRAEWGHWGITFYWQVPGVYAPERIEGTLHFPVGAAGPCDVPRRAEYLAIVKNWIDGGTLPQELVRR